MIRIKQTLPGLGLPLRFSIFLCGEISIDQQFGQKFGQPLTVGQMLKLNQEQETKLIVFLAVQDSSIGDIVSQ